MIAGPLESEVSRRGRPNRKAARKPGHIKPPQSGPRALTPPRSAQEKNAVLRLRKRHEDVLHC